MTLTVAWVRITAGSEEIVMATDSRLRFGCAWDCCPKILTLTRGDAAMCFAGDTMHAYPLMLQVKSSLEHHHATRTRERDLFELRSHLLNLMNGMRRHIHDLPAGQEQPDVPETVFIFAGYSWKQQNFLIWLLHYDVSIGRFTFRPSAPWPGQQELRMIAFAGDRVHEAKDRLIALLRERDKVANGGFDMEPFEVLRDMIRESAHPAIGGPPQVVKIFKSLNTVPLAIRWAAEDPNSLSFLGRPLLEYERTLYPVLDPDTLEIRTAWSFLPTESVA